jgi:thiamine kinase
MFYKTSSAGRRMLHLLEDWAKWNVCDRRPDVGQVEPLPGGLTNQSFLLHLESGDYVLRLEAGNSDELDIHRDVEYLVHQQAAVLGLVPKILYRRRDPDKYWIRQYLKGEMVRRETTSDSVLDEMAQRLHRLHQVYADERIPELSISAKAQRYWLAIQQHANGQLSAELDALFPRLQRLLSRAPDDALCICHMDPTLSNWIKTANGLQLVDWEYAALGHPLWDLAVLVQDAKLDDLQQQRLLSRYFADGGFDRHAWRHAQTQMKYIAALWYGAQGIWSLRDLEAYLLTLAAVDL